MKNLIMTGGTSGFGKITLQKFLKEPEINVFLGSRKDSETGIEFLLLDLSKLENVRSFTKEIEIRLKNEKIDFLVLNAGLSINGGTKTSDGYDTTFQVNYLSHYLLLRLLMPQLSEGATIVLTSSGTYDPAEKTIIPPPRHANPEWLAHPEKDPENNKNPIQSGGQAYSSSKLCIMLLVRAINYLSVKKERKWKVIAYDPGPTPGTGLVRGRNFIINYIWRMMGIKGIRNLIPGMNNIPDAGNTLANLTLGKINIPEGKIYAALRDKNVIYPELSDLAKRNDLMKNLWVQSAIMVGLPDSDEFTI
jgi:NAD(P)-dependent dehydrogenase (short-subunit alcohol dehydrogenase family)